MKSLRGWQVLLLSFLFFGPSDSKAQGIYFENWSIGSVTLYLDSTRSFINEFQAWDSEQFSNEVILQPGEYIHLDGNVYYDQTQDVYDYSWYTVPAGTTYNGGSGGAVGSPDLIAHYNTHGLIARVSVTRGDEELAVGRAVITNSGQTTYQFQGQSIGPGETVAFLSPANDAMWNSVWEEVQRFGTLVTQPNYLQWDAQGNWRNLDWQEKMMWWGGPADPVQWAWHVWDGQTFTHQGNEVEGSVPAGSSVAAPPVNPVNPNWTQVMTGNNTPPTTFTPTGGTSTPGGGGTGGGGTGTGTIDNGTIYIQFPTDYAREPTLQVVTNLLTTIDEDTGKIRQHTWGTNQRLDELLEGLDPDKPDGIAGKAKAKAENVAEGKKDDIKNEGEGVVAQVNQDIADAMDGVMDKQAFGFWDVLMNNIPHANGQFPPVEFTIAGQLVQISPHLGIWATFLPWVKGLLALVIMAIFVKEVHGAYSMYFMALGQTAPVVSNLDVKLLGNGAGGVTTPVNLGIQGAAFLLFVSFGMFTFTSLAASDCMVAVMNWMNVAFDPSSTGGNAGATYNWLAVLLDWTLATLPVVCAIELIILYYGLTFAMQAAYAGSVFGMKLGSI